jgi:hypothetical protein
MAIFLRGVADHPLKSPSQPLAGVGVADRGSKEAKAKGQDNDVQHLVLLTVPARTRNLAQARSVGLRQINRMNVRPADSSLAEVPCAA